MAMKKLGKDKFIPFIDTSDTVGSSNWVPTWKRVDLSTIFSLAPNPQESTEDYICYESAITEVTSYQPSLPQEISIVEGNPVYDFLFDKFYSMEAGAMTVPALICFGGTAKKAWQLRAATITLGELNTVDGKLSFTMNLGGDREKGTYTINEGSVTFSAANA